jgi:hypothetical protein
MIRINLNIAIVDMTSAKSKGQSILFCGNSTSNMDVVEEHNVVKQVILVDLLQWK